MTLDVYAAIVTGILLIVCVIQRRHNRQISRYLIGLCFAQILVFLSDLIRWSCRGKIEYLLLFKAAYLAEFILCYACLVFFHYYLSDNLHRSIGFPRSWRYIVWPIVVVMSVLWCLSLETRAFYIITYNAVNVAGDYFYLSQLPGMMLLLTDLIIVLLNAKRLGSRQAFSYALFLLFPLLSFPLQILWNSGVIFIGMTLSVLSRYITISAEQTRLLAESKNRLAESRVAITISQIQPHFLYNALGSISALCDEDPEKAQMATDNFAHYLRMNLDSMKRTSPIPFTKELEHIQTYIWLERMRFGDNLNFESDIQEEKFSVPALSVQPLVENAVRHGICVRQSGGTVRLSTYKENGNIIIKVEDDGVGFDISSLDAGSDEAPITAVYHHDPVEEKHHIGIENVRTRLKVMVGGELNITSIAGKGTTAVITLPGKENA